MSGDKPARRRPGQLNTGRLIDFSDHPVLLAVLRAFAEVYGMSISELIRQAIREYSPEMTQAQADEVGELSPTEDQAPIETRSQPTTIKFIGDDTVLAARVRAYAEVRGIPVSEAVRQSVREFFQSMAGSEEMRAGIEAFQEHVRSVVELLRQYEESLKPQGESEEPAGPS